MSSHPIILVTLTGKNKDVMLQQRFSCHKMSLCTIQVSAVQSLAWWVSRETETHYSATELFLSFLPARLSSQWWGYTRGELSPVLTNRLQNLHSSDTNMKHRWPNKHNMSHTFLVQNYHLKSKNGAHTIGNIWYLSIIMN
jgi:hypothetical protein